MRHTGLCRGSADGNADCVVMLFGDEEEDDDDDASLWWRGIGRVVLQCVSEDGTIC